MPKSCFVISVIGDEESSDRKYADRILNFIIKPVTTELGYDKPMRADQNSESGIVTNQIVKAIRDADLVIADVSVLNGNVFYELAIAHAAQRPTVTMALYDAVPLPFDIAGLRTVFFGTQCDEVENAHIKLKEAIKETVKAPAHYNNPIGVAVQIEAIASSSVANAKVLIELFEQQSSATNSMVTRLRQLEGAIANTLPSATGGYVEPGYVEAGYLAGDEERRLALAKSLLFSPTENDTAVSVEAVKSKGKARGAAFMLAALNKTSNGDK